MSKTKTYTQDIDSEDIEVMALKKKFNIISLAVVVLVLCLLVTCLTVSVLYFSSGKINLVKLLVDKSDNKTVSVFNNDEVQKFKESMMANNKAVKSINVSGSNVNLTIEYSLNNSITGDERERIFEDTKTILKEASFESSIEEEAGRKAFFGDVLILIKNPATKYNIMYQTLNYNPKKPESTTWNIVDLGKDL